MVILKKVVMKMLRLVKANASIDSLKIGYFEEGMMTLD